MARNHEEDQKGELEALESIYFNELEGKPTELVRSCNHVIDVSRFYLLTYLCSHRAIASH